MIAEAHRRAVQEYLRAVMQKRISFRSAEERKEGAERMVQEASQLRLLFRKLASVSAALALFPPGAVESSPSGPVMSGIE